MARILQVSVLIHILFIVKDVHAQIAQPFKINDWLNISCSVDAVGIVQWPGSMGEVISKIVLKRTPHDTNTLETLATYNAIALREGGFKVITKDDNNWFYEMEGGQDSGSLTDLIGNSANMRLDLKIREPTCKDAALYQCEFTYYDVSGLPQTYAVNENVTFIIPVSNLLVERTPFSLDHPNAAINSNLTFTCTVDGPDSLDMEWEWLQCPNDFGSATWFRPDSIEDVITNPKVIQSTSCTSFTYTYSSSYKLVMQNNICGIKCSVFSRLSNRVLEVSGSVDLVGVTETEYDREMASLSGGDSDDLGLILGLVFGLLALIIIVLLLVYFCWYRKRGQAPEDKYRDTEDSGSKPGNESYVPPPVYYTKPPKPEADIKDNHMTGIRNEALDNSFDSRDSANRGPPRYMNTPPEDVVVNSRYDTDAYQGRANRGYDGDRSLDNTDYNKRFDRDDEDGNGRDDRQYRRRTDRDRRRRYSNDDDGTANPAVSYNIAGDGDPNLGTAI